jgi:hypothetical protein
VLLLSNGTQDEKTKSWKKLVNVAVSGAAGMISNHLLFKVSSTYFHPVYSGVMNVALWTLSTILPIVVENAWIRNHLPDAGAVD